MVQYGQTQDLASVRSLEVLARPVARHEAGQGWEERIWPAGQTIKVQEGPLK